jgi:predicted Zn-dependent protease
LDHVLHGNLPDDEAPMVEMKADDVRMLAELGFVALSRGRNDEAAAIFAGVQAARPAQEAGFIGSSFVHLARGELDAAIKTLRSLPPSDTARTFLAMALNRSGDRAAAREILNEVVLSAGGSPDAVLARELLDELDAANEPLLR